MRYESTKKFFLFVVSFMLSGISTPCFSEDIGSEPLKLQTLKNIDGLDKSASIDLIMEFGPASAKQKINAIMHKYAGFKILNTCVGSFKKEGDHDIGLSLINPELKTGVYLALFSDKNLKDDLQEITRFSINFNDKGVLPKNLEVRCESWTGIMRIAQDYQQNEGEASASLKPLSHFDALCVAPFNQSEEFICYGYNGVNQKFSKIGGWLND